MPRSSYRVRRLSSEETLFRPPWTVRLWHFLTGDETWTSHHITVFLQTFFSFALIHATRKTLSTVKSSLIKIWTNSSELQPPLFPSEHSAENFLAFLDFGFLVAYAIGLFFGGILGDRFNPRIVLSIGMWLSALSAFLFGFATEKLQVYNIYVYAVLWIGGGLFQSVAWPNEVCVMGNWFGHGSRGIVMGFWSGCASVGNIIGTIITSKVIILGYEWAFAVNSCILFCFAFVVFWHLVPSPRDIGLPEPFESPDELNRVIEEPQERPMPISFWRAWILPGVIPYSLAYACLKLVNYGFFFWLPFYLSNNFDWPEADADNLSTWYDVGGIIAAIVAGAISDHYKSRTPTIVAMLAMSIFSLFGYSKSPKNYVINGVLLLVAGFFIGGPANMISGAISADLGKAREVRGNAQALSTVTGIIDGTGSLGAALGQRVIPIIKETFGWSTVFYGFIIMILLTISCLLPLLLKEIRAWLALRAEMLQYSENENLLQEDNDIHEHIA